MPGRIALVCLLAWACGDDKARRMPQGCGAPMCTPVAGPIDVNGRFGIFIQEFVDVQAAGGLVNQKGIETDVLLLADLTQMGLVTSMTASVCEFNLPPISVNGGKPLMFTIDSALLQSVPPITVHGTLSAAASCGQINKDPFAIVLGAKLTKPLTDPLPAGGAALCGGALMSCAQATAPAAGGCICDQEPDGKLGATFGLVNAPVLTDLDRAYVAERTTVHLTGQVFSSDRSAGTVSAGSVDLSILGCHRGSNGSADCSSMDVSLVQQISPVITQSDATMDSCLTSTFDARRVPPGTDCAALKRMKDQLFGL
jgi:hypothetical protein